jgi:tetratricopeptide (TPR) repeat protein
LGILSAWAGDGKAALRYYREAARLEPAERYQGNLAEQYLLLGDYARAIGIYETLDEYPLASLEAAKAHWARGELQQALSKQARALRWLEDPQVAALPKNQVRRRVDLSPEGASFSVASASCKHYYAELARAASRFLLEGKETLPAAAGCDSGDKIRQAVVEDLRRYASNQPGRTAFAERLLAQ